MTGEKLWRAAGEQLWKIGRQLGGSCEEAVRKLVGSKEEAGGSWQKSEERLGGLEEAGRKQVKNSGCLVEAGEGS